MTYIIAIVVGIIVGWLGSYAIAPDKRSYLINMVVGAAGGAVGYWFFGVLLGILSASTAFNFFLIILWALIGALIFTAISSVIISSKREKSIYEKGTPHEYHKYKEEEEKKKEEDKK